MSSSPSSPRRLHLHKAPPLAPETGPGGGRTKTLPLHPRRLPQPPPAAPRPPALCGFEMQIYGRLGSLGPRREGRGGLGQADHRETGGILIPAGSSLQEEGNGLSRWLEEQVNRLQWEMCKMCAAAPAASASFRLAARPWSRRRPVPGRCEGRAPPRHPTESPGPASKDTCAHTIWGWGDGGKLERERHILLQNPQPHL